MLHNSNGNDSNLSASGLQDPISSSTIDSLSLSSRSSSPTGADSGLRKYYFTYKYNPADDLDELDEGLYMEDENYFNLKGETVTHGEAVGDYVPLLVGDGSFKTTDGKNVWEKEGKFYSETEDEEFAPEEDLEEITDLRKISLLRIDADYYKGYVIGEAGAYANNLDVSDLLNEAGWNGNYEITDEAPAKSGDQKGAVVVTSYYDYNPNTNEYTKVTPYNVTGNEGLGSEIGYFADTKDTAARFGADKYEANPVSSDGNGGISTKTKLYTFEYKYGNGDSYTGYTIDEAGKYGVSASQEGKLTTGIKYDPYAEKDENGKISQYTITGVYSVSDSFSEYIGQVHVDSYFDKETDKSLAPKEVNAGYKGLGSEFGLLTGVYGDDIAGAVKNDLFGYDYFEADPKSLKLYQYVYKFDGDNGDTYTGFTVDVEGKYSTEDSYDSPFYKSNNEIGKSSVYEIVSVKDIDSSFSKYIGWVSVESYYDSETKKTLTPKEVNSGYKGLGSEFGLLTGDYSDDLAKAVKDDLFGYDYFEADLAASDVVPTTDVSLYKFIYFYDKAAATTSDIDIAQANAEASENAKDFYTGYFYDEEGKYSEDSNYNYTTELNEVGKDGTYRIIGITTADSSSDSDRIGEIGVESYYDTKSGMWIDELTDGTGTDGIGSELGYLSKEEMDSEKFGQDYYEADYEEPEEA